MKHKGKKKHKQSKLWKFELIIFYISFITLVISGCVVYNSLSKEAEVEEVETIPTAKVYSYIPQFVLLSFDGSKSVDMWRKIRVFKTEMTTFDKPINFTHFINAAYFLTEETKDLYTGPNKIRGTSEIGFSDDLESLKKRIVEVNKAKESGDEIASHAVGHFSGSYWSKEDWLEEFNSFENILFDLPNIYPNENLPILNLARTDIVGFRAPFLDKSSGLYEALHEKHFLYDTSEVGRSNEDWPRKDKEGLWHIPMGNLNFEGRTILAMDYNLWMHHMRTGENDLKRGTPEWDRVYKKLLKSFLDYFDENYNTNRAPVLIGYHFEEWNGGVYWEALKEFAREVCGKPEVECKSFKELVEYMEEYGVPKNQ